MEEVVTRILDKGDAPKRSDISELLASIAKPGEKRDDKDKAVKDLFDELGHNGLSFQGHAMWDDLTGYGEY